MSEKLQDSKDNGVHFQLAKLEGEWEGTTKVWFEPCRGCLVGSRCRRAGMHE